MIPVFISYPDERKTDAEELYLFLKEKENIEPILAPKREGVTEELSERVTELIRNSQYFIIFYTPEAKSNAWVNQELGYAYYLLQQKAIKIIPIYEDRKDIQGLLTSKSYHLDSGCDMAKGKDVVYEVVKRLIVGENMYPIELTSGEISNVNRGNGKRIELILDLFLEVKSFKVYKNCVIDFVLPDNVQITANEVDIAKKKESGRIMEYHSRILPTKYNDYFDKKYTDSYYRVTVFFGELQGINTYQTRWKLFTNRSDLKFCDFGIYLQMPEFGVKFYECQVFFEEKSRVNKLEPVNIKVRKVGIRSVF